MQVQTELHMGAEEILCVSSLTVFIIAMCFLRSNWMEH